MAAFFAGVICANGRCMFLIAAGHCLISNLNPDDQGFFNVHNYDLGKSGCFETLDDKDGVIDLSHQRQSGTFEHDL